MIINSQTIKSTSAGGSRLLRIAVCLIFMLTAGVSFGQSAKVNINVNKEKLSTLFDQISKQSGYKIFYSNNSVDVSRIVTIVERNAVVSELLNKILPQLGMTYKFVDNTIVISSTKPEAHTAKAIPVRQVTGKVSDESGVAVVGASVVVKGDSRRGTSTTVNGSFTLNVPLESKVLVVSMIGMQTTEVAINGDAPLKVTMKADVIEAENVVVTGYVPKAKNSFTGTATQVSGDQLRQVNPTNALEALQVFDPSFVISDMQGIYGSNPNFIPERITIRGQSSMPDISQESLQTYTSLPIFILDGFQVTVEEIYNLDINRIETATVLKDAAASSIYGSRAANGVIVITTKMPKKGSIQVSYTFNGSIETPDLSSYNLMNSNELVQYYEKMDVFKLQSNGTPDNYNLLQLMKQEAANGVDTYWLSQPLRTSFQQAHSVILEGGANVGKKKGQDRSLRYMINLSANLQDGVMKGSDRNVYGGGTKLIYDTKKLQITGDLQVSFTNLNNSPYGDFSKYTQLLPIFRIKDSEGNLLPTLSLENVPLYDNYPWTSGGAEALGIQINPLYEATQLNNYSKGSQFNASYRMGANWELIPDLRLRANFTIDRSENTSEDYISPFSLTVSNSLTSGLEDILRKGEYKQKSSSATNYYGMVNLSYMKTLGKHTLMGVLGGEIKENNNESDSFSAIGFLNDYMNYPSNAVQYPLSGRPSGSSGIVRTVGTFLTFNYSFENRYMFDFSYRLDGSSNFASKQRVSDFWAVGARWNLTNEKFMKNQKLFDKFAIKANIGTTGNANFALSQILSMYKYLSMYDGVIGAEIMSLANPNLKWQTTLNRNLGIEATFFKNLLNFEFNVYYNTTKNNITDVSILPSTGFKTYVANQGDVNNKGFEFNISATPIKTKDWQLNIFVNGSHNRNKLAKLSDSLKDYNDKIISEQVKDKNNKTAIENIFLFEEGKSLSSIYAVPSAGIDPGTGQEIFIKKNGERTFTWDAADQVVVGDTEADLYGYFGAHLNYRRWQLSTTFEYSFGGDMYNQTLISRIENTSMLRGDKIAAYNMDRRALYERWSKPGDVAKYRGATNSTILATSSRFVQRNDYVKMNSLKVMYTITKPNTKLWGFSMLKVSLSTNDMFYMSKIKQERGLSYPYSRKYYVTLQANF